MGVFQLPDSVDADAAGCLIYSFFCFFANGILIWLIWTHHERTSYVAYISYFTFLATVSSLVQQIYDYALWRDIMIEQFYYGKTHADDAETQYQKAIMGLKLGLAYIRIFCFIVESSLVLFFSFSLAATVFGWWAKKPHVLRKLSVAGRIVPIAFALLSIILLQLDFTHQSFTLYFILANAQLVLSLAGSCIFLLMILFKYVQTRRQLKTWQSIQYGKQVSTATSGTKSGNNRRSRAYSSGGKPSATFDKWLVIRLSIAFMTLSVFEWTNIAPRISAKGHIVESVNETEPDLSESRAMATVTGYLSGVSPSLLAFVVFGTTKTFQRKMYRTFVPRAIRHRFRLFRSADSNHGDDEDGRLPFSSAGGGSSLARASTVVVAPLPPPPPPGADAKSTGSTSAPTTPRSPRRGSLRKFDRASFLLPIQEPSRIMFGGGTDDDEDDNDGGNDQSRTHRRSQIGVAVSGSPELLEPQPIHSAKRKSRRGQRRATFGTFGTFFRDDSLESLQQIPLSRFNVNQLNNNDNGGGGGSKQQHKTNNMQLLGRSDSFTSTTTTTTIWSEGRPVSVDNRGAIGRSRFNSVS